MKKSTIVVGIFACISFLTFSNIAMGHGLGTIVTKEISDSTILEFEYEAVELVENKTVLLEYRVKQNDVYLDIERSFINISDDQQLVILSVNAVPETLSPSIVRLNTVFPESGNYEINLRLKLKDKEESIRTSIDLVVSEDNFFNKNWILLVTSATLGTILGIILGVVWKKNIK